MNTRESATPLRRYTGVLWNRLGITDASELERAEASFVAWRSYELSQKPVAGRFDLAHLQAMWLERCHPSELFRRLWLDIEGPRLWT